MCDPLLVKALARAFRCRRMLEDGRYGSIRDLAKAEGADRAQVGPLLWLTLLAPEVVEAVPEGQQSDGRTPQLLNLVHDIWAEQCAAARICEARRSPFRDFGKPISIGLSNER